MAAIFMMGAMAACSDEMKSPDDDIADDNAITFSILTESQQAASRALSDGSLVDHLYYAIYREKEQEPGEYELDTFYNPEGKIKADFTKTTNFTLKLIPDPSANENTRYKIVCWAQHGDEFTNTYYNLSLFPVVTVNYVDDNGNSFGNNDETRDAFYASREFTPQLKGTVVKVELVRPFAQINIGTSGWDFEGLASIKPNPTVVKYSKIKISGAANTLDILASKAEYVKPENAEGNQLVVDYNFEVIPAYRNIKDTEVFKKLSGIKVDDQDNYFTDGLTEEFLKIKLERPAKPSTGEDHLEEDKGESGDDEFNDGFADYICWKDYDYYCATSGSHEALLYKIHTETFKYLSMCYVLVPFSVAEDDKTTRSIVDVEFDCAESDATGAVKPEGIYGAGKNVIELKNVPAYRNHRTNIIAADGTGFFMNSNEMKVQILSETFANYYKQLAADDKDWDESEGENGSEVNGDYEWPDKDIEPGTPITPADIRMVISNTGYIKPYITDTYHNDSDNKIYAFSFREASKNQDVTFRVDGYFRNIGNATSDTYEKDLSYAFNYEFYLEDTPVSEMYYKKMNNGYNFTLPVEELTKIIESKNISRTQPSASEKTALDLWYYPVKLSIQLTSKNEHQYVAPEGYAYETEVRVYPIIEVYTFSDDSTDEGGELMKDFKAKGVLGITLSNSKEEEKGAYFITGKSGVVETDNLKLNARDPGSGSNDKAYNMRDHIYMRGASNDKGHWLFLKNLAEDCRITVKIGRDKDEDNTDKNKMDEPFNRILHINWGQCSINWTTLPTGDYVDNWMGYPVTDTEHVRFTDPNDKTTKTVYNFFETKIMKSSEKTGLSSPKDVQLYVERAGHAYYWVILSVPEN